MTPPDIINRWIATAEERRMGRACAEFWTVRDIFEGVLRVSTARREKALEFVKQCKASDELDILVKSIEEATQ